MWTELIDIKFGEINGQFVTDSCQSGPQSIEKVFSGHIVAWSYASAFKFFPKSFNTIEVW